MNGIPLKKTRRATSRLIAGLLLLCCPAQLWAEVCDKERPLWTPGTPATALDEAMHLFANPLSLLLLLGTALAIRFRSQWGGLAVVVGWVGLMSLVSFVEVSPDITRLAINEGCIGSPILFMAAVAAICVGTILYTAPLPKRST